MTNKRITELTALDGDDVADNDVLAIVDVSDTTMAASGTTKKITVAELVTDSALTNKFWPNSTTALTGANLANGDKLAVVDVGSPDVPKYSTADELAQGSQFSSRYKPLASDVVWLPSSVFEPVGGSSRGATGIGSSYFLANILFDQSAAEYALTNFYVPPSWTTMDIDIFWTHGSDVATGDVKWAWWQRRVSADGDNLDTRDSPDGTVLTTAGNRAILKVSRVRTGASVSSGMYWTYLFRSGDAVDDTFNADAALLGVRLTRAS
jgi:hypothetical protein